MADSAETPGGAPRSGPAGDDLSLLLRMLSQRENGTGAHPLPSSAGSDPADMVTHLREDQRRRWLQGRGLPAEEYLRCFAWLSDDPERALVLVYGEFLLREGLGQRPDPAEYVRRFPGYAARLRQQFSLHAALTDGSNPGTGLVLTSGSVSTSDARDAPPAEPGHDAPLPAVPGYEILRELGRGGMGVVYQAVQQLPRRPVALKMILAGAHAGSERRARLLAEAEAIARLRHPHIVQIYQAGEHSDLPFLALEFMPGGNLAEHLAGQPQPALQAAALAEALARAVAHAHAAGVIHRDLKPANVLLADDGTAKISDFSLAKLGDVDLTATGAILGTPSYMAPEQAGGSRVVGPAADVYAVGAILYELLTGRPPFRAATAIETLEQVRLREPVPVQQLQPGVPADLATVCLKCLEKDPARRYASAGELADDLRRFLEYRPILARRASRVERVRRWVRRNPWPATAGWLLVVLVAGSILAAWRLSREAARARGAERDATAQLYDALRARAESSRGSGLPGQRIESLRALRQAVAIARDRGLLPDELLQLRNQAIACLALPDLSVEQEWDGSQPGTYGFDFDARFERYAWYDLGGGVHVCRRADHRELCRLPGLAGGRVTRNVKFRFSPEGRFLAVYYSLGWEKCPVQVWDLQGNLARPLVTLPDATARPEFTPDGRSLVTGLPGGALTLIDLRSGLARDLVPGWSADSLALHPGGASVAVASNQSQGFQVRDLRTGAVTAERRHPAPVDAAAWSPDGGLLAVACNDHLIHLWDASTWKELGTLGGHRWAVHDLCFDATGRWLASFGWDMTLRIWDVGSRRQILHVNEVRVTSFRPEGGLAVAGISSRRVKVWTFHPSTVYDQLHGVSSLTHQFNFSPDGRWLVVRGPSEEMCLWDLNDRRLAGRWPELGMAVWGPDGSWLLAGGAGGLVSLPVRTVAGASGTPGLRIGPCRRLDGVAEDARAWGLDWLGPGGRRLLVRRGFPAPFLRVVEVNEGSCHDLWTASHYNCNFLTSSRDGGLVATGSFVGGDGVRVWDGSTGHLLRELAIGDSRAAFGADGSRLFTTTGRLSPRGSECRAWRLDNFSPETALVLNQSSSSPAPLSVGSDGTVAVGFTNDDACLLEPDGLSRLAVLSAPDPRLIPIMEFSPDASMLAVSSSGTVDLWDLRRLREELAQMGLDWERPPYPPSRAPAGPVRVAIIP